MYAAMRPLPRARSRARAAPSALLRPRCHTRSALAHARAATSPRAPQATKLRYTLCAAADLLRVTGHELWTAPQLDETARWLQRGIHLDGEELRPAEARWINESQLKVQTPPTRRNLSGRSEYPTLPRACNQPRARARNAFVTTP